VNEEALSHRGGGGGGLLSRPKKGNAEKFVGCLRSNQFHKNDLAS
jgi:hypothetical protein